MSTEPRLAAAAGKRSFVALDGRTDLDAPISGALSLDAEALQSSMDLYSLGKVPQAAGMEPDYSLGLDEASSDFNGNEDNFADGFAMSIPNTLKPLPSSGSQPKAKAKPPSSSPTPLPYLTFAGSADVPLGFNSVLVQDNDIDTDIDTGTDTESATGIGAANSNAGEEDDDDDDDHPPRRRKQAPPSRAGIRHTPFRDSVSVVTGPSQKAERINLQMLEQADNLSEDHMLPKQIRENAHEAFKEIGWWTNAVFYRAIAVEGVVWWYNASKRYQSAPDGASEGVIFQGCCAMLSMVQSTIKLAKSLNPNLTSGKRLHSNGIADLLDPEDEGSAATGDGFDARSQYGIGNIKVDSVKRYALVFASILRFLNNLARVHGQPLPFPSSLNVLDEQEVASHIVKVVAALEWPSVPGAVGFGPLAQAVAALCLRDNRSLITVQQGAMPDHPSELGLCDPRQLEATCSAVMYCLKSVMLWYGVLVPESRNLLFDASRSGGILAKIKGLFNHMPPTATRQQRFMYSQELSKARNGSAVCLISSPNSAP